MTTAHPLQWPPGWRRTEPYKRKQSRFGQKTSRVYGYGLGPVTMTKARGMLIDELNRLGAKNIVISTNLELRLDGLPKANRKPPEDVGVAVYFTKDGSQMCFPCDKWDRIEDNMYAIAKTIDALRGIERWGAKETVTASFRGFEQIPNDIKPRSFYFKDCETKEEIKTRFQKLVKAMHPDQGGDEEEFRDMIEQYETLMKKEGD